MLPFWPSLSLLVFFLVIFLECRAIAGRVTLPLGSFLTVFCYGAIGAPLLALLLQQFPIFPDAGVEPAAPIAWLIGPPIEELAKAVPVIVLAFFTREARRLSIADLTLVGFASGAGFGFVEGNLNAIVNGTLPSLQHVLALGLQSENGAVSFAGHAVSTALVGLAAGIGLRFLPVTIAYAWAPAAFVILWMSFDHGIYNWKLLNATSTSALPAAHIVVEILHVLTLRGQLAIWLLLIGLTAAQFFEAHLCTKAVGARRDLLLAREWRPWVINEWLVVLLRAPLGRAVFGQTLAYFRLRRAFYLATLEARRDPGDPTWSRHARALEERLKRERSILFDPAPGTWLLPFSVLKTYAIQWTWRMRWVLPFVVLLFFLFMLDPASLPGWLRQFLFGKPFTIVVVAAGLAFAVWRIVLFARMPQPDPLAADGAACAGYYTRALLLGCSFVCGLFPTLALLLGWKALAPGAAFISGYLPGWIGQGGNLQTLLGLGAIGSAVAPDPRPTGEAFRDEIAAGEERIRRLGWEIEDKTGAADGSSPGAAKPLQLDGFLDAMAKLDAERDAQARRQLALDELERHAGEATVRDPAPAVQAVKDEFDRLAGELLETAAKELDAIASLEQAYSRAWAEIMRDLDTHDTLRRRLRNPLRRTWQTQNDVGWALRVVDASDEGLLPMQLALLPDLQAIAASSQTSRSDMVAAGVERIRATAALYSEADPFTFAGADDADEDEAALLAEFSSAEPAAEAPKSFGLRAPQPADAPIPQAQDRETSAAKTEEPGRSRTQRYQDALGQLISAAKDDERYLETIRHLERSAESLRQPIAPAEDQPQSADPVTEKTPDAVETRAEPIEAAPSASPPSGHQDDLEDLIDAIKRDSGYLGIAKDTQAARAQDDRVQETTKTVAEADEAPSVDVAEPEAPQPDASEALEEPVVASAPTEPTVEHVGPQEIAPAQPPDPAAELSGTPSVAEIGHEIETPSTDDSNAVDQPAASTPAEPADKRVEQAETTAAQAAPAASIVADEAAEADQAEAPAAKDDTVETHVASAPAEAADLPLELDLSLPTYTPESLVAPSEAPAETQPVVEAAEPDVAADAQWTTKAAQPSETTTAPEQGDELALPAEAAKATFETPADADVRPSESPHVDDTLSKAPEPQPAEDTASHAKTAGSAQGKESASDEPPRKAAQSKKLRGGDKPATPFSKLVRSVRRQSRDTMPKPVRWDQNPQELDAKPAQPFGTPTLEDRTTSPLPEPREPESRKSPGDAATKSDWLADFTTPKAEGGKSPLKPIEWPALNRSARDDLPTAKSDTASTEIAQPAQAADENAQALPASAPADGDAKKIIASDARTPTSDTVEPIAESNALDVKGAELRESALSEDTTRVATPSEAPAVEDHSAERETADAAASDSSPQRGKPAGVDDFSSKADRLSHLLVKLEQAMHAKSAAPAAPSEQPAISAIEASATADEEHHSDAQPQPQGDQPDEKHEPTAGATAQSVASTRIQPPTADEADHHAAQPNANDPTPSVEPKIVEAEPVASAPDERQESTAEATAPTEIQPSTPDEADHHAAQPHASDPTPSVEPKIAEPEQPAVQTAEADQQPATPTLDVQLGASQPTEVEQTHTTETGPATAPSQAQESSDAQLKPDRLSFLLTKLFDAVKRQSVEQDAPPEEGTVTPPADSALERPAASEVLDLRGPEPLPDLPEPNIESKPLEPLDNPEPEETAQPATPDEPAAAQADPQPAEVDETSEADHTKSAEAVEPVRSEPEPSASDSDAAPADDTAQSSEQPVEPKPKPRTAESAPLFGSKSKTPRAGKPARTRGPELEPSPPKKSPEPAAAAMDAPATTPKRDWKLTTPSRGETPKPTETDAGAAKKSETTIRVKTGSGALATTDTSPVASTAATANTPGKYYGPRLAKTDDDHGANSPAEQRALSLADALTEYYAKAGEPQPPMHTTDRATLQRIITNGKLEAPRRRGAAWSTSGMSRRGEVVIRLRPGAEQFIEFVPSTEIFGQMPHYYPRGVGKGSFATHVPAQYLEYFDVSARQWAPLLRGGRE